MITQTFKRAWHPSGRHMIRFDEEPHTYTDQTGRAYTSATSLISQFFEHFDAEKQALECSRGKNPEYRGRAPGDIRREWEAEKERGQREGTNAHEYAESLISRGLNCPPPLPISDRCNLLFDIIQGVVHQLLMRFVYVGAEVIVFAPDLSISGMIDLLMFDPLKNEIVILDWKQNKKITKNNFYQTGKKPIQHLEDTDLNHYALQLNLYQYLLTREGYYPNVGGYRRAIIHLSESGAKFHKLDYLQPEIKEILTEWDR